MGLPYLPNYYLVREDLPESPDYLEDHYYREEGSDCLKDQNRQKALQNYRLDLQDYLKGLDPEGFLPDRESYLLNYYHYYRRVPSQDRFPEVLHLLLSVDQEENRSSQGIRLDLPENRDFLESPENPLATAPRQSCQGLQSHQYRGLRHQMNCRSLLLRNPMKRNCQKNRYLVKNPLFYRKLP